MLKNILILSAVLACANADITLQDLNSKPSSHAKNFMIWQYLKQNISSEEADIAYAQVDGNVDKIKKLYLKKSNNETLQREAQCKTEKDLLSIDEKDCLELAMSPYKTLSLDDRSRKKLIGKLESDSAKNLVKIQAEPYSEKAYKAYDAKTVLTMFVSTTKNHRRENLNIKLSKSFINSIFSEDKSSWRKYSFVQTVLNDEKLDNLRESLLLVDGELLDEPSNFLFALYYLKKSDIKNALKHLELGKEKAQKRIDADKNLFWIYMATSDSKHLEELSLSSDINIYTLYAKEKLGKSVKNYFTSVETIDENSQKDICNPFDWDSILKEIREAPKSELANLSLKYKQKDMEPVQSLIMEKVHDYKVHGFIMPYDKYLEGVSNDDKALIYALMRQESYLIPSALSRSFALGLMQIMPFVTDDLSKKVDEPILCYDDMFKPSYNIQYALKHLEWMKKSLYHPLFTAYAYNGGMGYFKRHLEGGAFNKGKYEPFLSMETMLNAQSREYGKKVLSNYVIYKKILGEKVSIVDLLNSLTDPKKTDRFRL